MVYIQHVDVVALCDVGNATQLAQGCRKCSSAPRFLCVRPPFTLTRVRKNSSCFKWTKNQYAGLREKYTQIKVHVS